MALAWTAFVLVLLAPAVLGFAMWSIALLTDERDAVATRAAQERMHAREVCAAERMHEREVRAGAAPTSLLRFASVERMHEREVRAGAAPTPRRSSGAAAGTTRRAPGAG